MKKKLIWAKVCHTCGVKHIVTQLEQCLITTDDKKHTLGQYFTTNNALKEKVYAFILNNPSVILEPSIGRGDLITFVKEHRPEVEFAMYEIDDTLELLPDIDPDEVMYGDFMEQSISQHYQTIIGNPPFIRTKKGNLYIDFTEKCYRLLSDGGELIFIVPSDFLKLTSAAKVLNEMMQNGTFTHIYHPHNEKLFDDATIDVIVFRYCKNNVLEKKVIYNDKALYIINSNGLITFSAEPNSNLYMFKDYFDIYVGIVNGKEEVYKNKTLGNIEVLNGEDKVEKYIYIEQFPSSDTAINAFLLEHKPALLKRQIKKFNESNWFEWGAPRNISAIKKHRGQECIYIYNLTRKDRVAFIGKVGYFGGSLLMLLPKKGVKEEKMNLNKITDYLNSNTFKSNFMFSKRFKIGHRQLSQSYIPNGLL
jgi:adenine-specific DNA-methyltransferase